jgi:F-type H+-transporting ATPase subunit epsilon
MAAVFPFEIHTPYRRFFAEEVEAVVITLSDGEAAVYANHSAFTAPVISCVFKIKTKKGVWKTAFTAEGILEVKNHKTVLMSEAAEWPEEIDYERAKNAGERARETLTAGGMKFEIDKAAAALRRAQCRMRVWETAQGASTTAPR